MHLLFLILGSFLHLSQGGFIGFLKVRFGINLNLFSGDLCGQLAEQMGVFDQHRANQLRADEMMDGNAFPGGTGFIVAEMFAKPKRGKGGLYAGIGAGCVDVSHERSAANSVGHNIAHKSFVGVGLRIEGKNI